MPALDPDAADRLLVRRELLLLARAPSPPGVIPTAAPTAQHCSLTVVVDAIVHLLG